MDAMPAGFPDNDDGLWYQLRDVNQFLYHYTTADILLDHILSRQELRFSSFERLNDPYEYKQLSLVWSAQDGFDQGFTPEAKDAFARDLRRNLRVACFSADASDSEISSLDDPLQLTAGPYQRGHSLAQMWAHYGNRHTGACMVFARDSLLQAVKIGAAKLSLGVASGRVGYSNWPAGILSSRLPAGFRADYDELREVGQDEAVRRHIEREWQSLFLAKTKAWSGEQEFRILLWGEAPEYVCVSYTNSLVGIMLGENFPAEKKHAVGKYAIRHSIRTASMDWLNGFPQPKVFQPEELL